MRKYTYSNMKPSSLLTLYAFVIVSSALFTINSLSGTRELIFKKHGNHVKTLSLENLEKLIPPLKVEVFEPLESVKREYIGFPVNQLLTIVYGDSWKEVDNILFTCEDGYQPSIPTHDFIRFKSYLAYARSDKEEFTSINRLQNDELVKLAPFYLVWDDIKFPELHEIGSVHWPYQITAIDLIKFSDHFPGMAPPGNSPDNVKNGFIAFQTHCMSCHTINGEGGKKARELNYPVNVTEYIKEPWLKEWINNPRTISYNSTMPAFSPNAKDREKTIDNIISYLKLMKDNKRKPKQ